MPVTRWDLTLASAYSTAWSGSVSNPQGNVTSILIPYGGIAFEYEESVNVNTGDRNIGSPVQCTAVGSAGGTVDLAAIPSSALITGLRVRAGRAGRSYASYEFWKEFGGGTGNMSAVPEARVTLTAPHADIAVAVTDTPAQAVAGYGSIPPLSSPEGYLFHDAEVEELDGEEERVEVFASITKAAFVAATPFGLGTGWHKLTAVVGVNRNAYSYAGTWGSQPFVMLFNVTKEIEGGAGVQYIEFELTWDTPSTPFGLSPDEGPYTGGTLVTISGVGFTGVTNVMFGDVPATDFDIVSDTTILAVAPPADPLEVVTVSIIHGAAVTDIGPYTYLPSDSYWPPGGGPPGGGSNPYAGRIMIVSPNVGTNYSRGKTVTMVSGTPLTNYPVVNLVDDSADSALRLSETQFDLYIDLGAERTPDVLAILNHNLDDDLLVQVLAGPSPGFAVPVGNFNAGRLNGWLDLRAMSHRVGRYWKIRVTDDNSVPVTIGEVVIGSAYVMEGVIEPDWKRQVKYFVSREYTEEFIPYKMHSGARQRQVQISFVLNPANRTIIETVFDDAGTTGNRVLVIPDTGKNDPYFIDWPSRREFSFPQSLLEAKIALMLTEQSEGVI